jgi:hypothetical protein
MFNDPAYLTIWIDSIDPFNRLTNLVELLDWFCAFIPAVAGVGEVDTPVIVHHEVVRRIVALPFKSICQNSNGSIKFGPRNTPIPSLSMSLASMKALLRIEQ